MFHPFLFFSDGQFSFPVVEESDCYHRYIIASWISHQCSPEVHLPWVLQDQSHPTLPASFLQHKKLVYLCCPDWITNFKGLRIMLVVMSSVGKEHLVVCLSSHWLQDHQTVYCLHDLVLSYLPELLMPCHPSRSSRAPVFEFFFIPCLLKLLLWSKLLIPATEPFL